MRVAEKYPRELFIRDAVLKVDDFCVILDLSRLPSFAHTSPCQCPLTSAVLSMWRPLSLQSAMGLLSTSWVV